MIPSNMTNTQHLFQFNTFPQFVNQPFFSPRVITTNQTYTNGSNPLISYENTSSISPNFSIEFPRYLKSPDQFTSKESNNSLKTSNQGSKGQVNNNFLLNDNRRTSPQNSLFGSSQNSVLQTSHNISLNFNSESILNPQQNSFSSSNSGRLFGSSNQGNLYGTSNQGNLFGTSNQGNLFGTSNQGNLFGSSSSGGLFSGSPRSGGLFSGSPRSGGLFSGSPRSGGLFSGAPRSGGIFSGSSLFGLSKSNHNQSKVNLIFADLPSSEIQEPKLLPEDKKNCTICLENFVSKDVVKTLPCLHLFHETCIKSWIVGSRHNKCPVCNFKIDSVR